MANDPPKKHVCHWQDCGKTFSRSDHLQRHMLNHSAEGSTCERCRAHFKRPDLLERHMARHKQKDEEAGGEGLGIVETRKRMWRDADGNIVSKRPAYPNHIAINRAGGAVGLDGPGQGHDQLAGVQAPPSPPKSHPGTDFTDPQIQYQDDMNASNEQHMFDYVPQMSLHDQGGNDMFDFLANSSWGQKSSQTNQTTGLKNSTRMWDDAFAPDTASSFNMPYTTMNNYNWLFDVNPSSTNFEAQMPAQLNAWVPQMTNETLTSFNQATTMQAPHHSNGASLRQSIHQQQQHQVPHSLPMQAFLAQQEYRSHPTVDEQSAISSCHKIYSSRASEDQSMTSSTSPEALSASDFSIASSQTSASQHSMSKRKPSSQGTRQSPSSSLEAASVLSFHPCSAPRSLPTVCEDARQRILDLIIQAGTRTPDGILVNRDHPLLSLQSLQTYCDLFFTRFNNSYPLLHKSTFDPSQVETLFLLSVLLLGATYGDKTSHRLAVCIHDIMRAQLFQHMSFTADPELWVLQTILLVECFGKSRAGQKQHDMSHLFHGLLINLIRRSDCQTVQQPDMSDSLDDLDTQWRRAMDCEQRKRLCQLCFLWDVQHAVLFSQSLCMSSFEIRTALPCSPVVWEAESAQEWQQHVSREPAPKLFLPVLKSYMSPTAPTQSHNLNALSRLLILHGLMSVSWDFTRRDQTSLGCGSLTGTDDWRARIGASYDVWKADFDTYCLNISSSLNKATYAHNPSLKSDFQRFTTSTLAIYHAAHIVLNIEILDLQIYAGARHIIGRPVSSGDYERSRRKVRDWAQQKPTGGTTTSNACTAVWHAAQLLRDGITNLDNWDVNNAFHYPWCLYLATLTCWAFHYGSRDDRPASMATATNNYDARSSEDAVSMSMGMYSSTTATNAARNVVDENEDDDYDTLMYDAKADMNALVSGMTSGVPEGLWRIAGKYSTRGLTTVMAQHLSNVRWAVVHEGMKVLRGLMRGQEAL